MDKIKCPMCNKELKRLRPDNDYIYIYHCKNCELDIAIMKNNKTEELLDNTFKT